MIIVRPPKPKKKRNKRNTGVRRQDRMPKASAVTITKADGSVEKQPAFKTRKQMVEAVYGQ